MVDPVCDICCRPKSRHKGCDLQCVETTYFREMQPAAISPPPPTEGAEIVERLLERRQVVNYRGEPRGFGELYNRDGLDAVAELTRLRQRVAELERRAVDAVFSAKFPKERWSCGTDESGIRLTLQRQQHWIADAVKRALIHQPNGDELK